MPAMQQRDQVDKTISDLLMPSKLVGESDFADQYVNTENSINLVKTVENLQKKLSKGENQAKKFQNAQELLSAIQKDTKITRPVPTFYNSLSKKVSQFLSPSGPPNGDLAQKEKLE